MALQNMKIWVHNLNMEGKKEVQDLLFELGYTWGDEGYCNLISPAYSCYEDGMIYWWVGSLETTFFNHPNKEVTLSDLRKMVEYKRKEENVSKVAKPDDRITVEMSLYEAACIRVYLSKCRRGKDGTYNLFIKLDDLMEDLGVKGLKYYTQDIFYTGRDSELGKYILHNFPKQPKSETELQLESIEVKMKELQIEHNKLKESIKNGK